MINLVYEHEWKPNIWFPAITGYSKIDIHRCHKYKRQIPWILQIFLDDINIISPNEIDTVDSFIYPILMQEPYVQIRTLIANHHDDFGLWTHIHPKVIESLRNGKGIVLLDATMEPVNFSDMEQVVQSLKDCSQYPNDRIHLNISDQRFIDNVNYHCFPSFLEIHFCSRHLYDVHDTFLPDLNQPNKTFRFKPPLDYEHPRHPDIDGLIDGYESKRYLLLNKRVDKHLGAVFINYLLDRYNLLKYGLVSLDYQGDTIPELYEQLKHSSNDTNFSNVIVDALKTAKNNTTDDFLTISKANEATRFNLVVEAYFSDNVIDWPLITEKIWRNVASEKLFVVVGQKDTLKWFSQLGYKSFHPLIDESYDQITSDFTRIIEAFIQARRLIEMSEKEFDELESNSSHIFIHNQKNFEERIRRLWSFLND
tara:strand:+ start:2400 stop:3668 length:1269 start_codon:yes stop_codon:yes gene_type:complete